MTGIDEVVSAGGWQPICPAGIVNAILYPRDHELLIWQLTSDAENSGNESAALHNRERDYRAICLFLAQLVL